jgi:hypothetical protein
MKKNMYKNTEQCKELHAVRINVPIEVLHWHNIKYLR